MRQRTLHCSCDQPACLYQRYADEQRPRLLRELFKQDINLLLRLTRNHVAVADVPRRAYAHHRQGRALVGILPIAQHEISPLTVAA